MQLNICSCISVRTLEIVLTGVFRRLINQAAFKLQEQNFNRLIHTLPTYCMLMIFSYTLITITTMNLQKLTAISEVSGEHTVSWTWCCVVQNEYHASWWSWATKVMVTSLEAFWWDKWQRRLLSSPSFLITVGVLAFLLSLFLPNRAYTAFDFPVHPCGVFGRRSCLLAVSSACLVLHLVDACLLSLEFHQSFLAPLVVTTIPCLHKMHMHGVWLCCRSITRHMLLVTLF